MKQLSIRVPDWFYERYISVRRSGYWSSQLMRAGFLLLWKEEGLRQRALDLYRSFEQAQEQSDGVATDGTDECGQH